jgi:phosphate/phosphite/phosphonate ABC transporter binding protein
MRRGRGAAVGLLWAVACLPAITAGAAAQVEDVTSVAAAGSERPTELVFGLTPFLPREAMEREFGPLAHHLSERVGLPVRLRVADDYAHISELIGAFEVHVAQLGPLAYVEAKREHPGLVLLATQIAQGTPTYAAYLVARSGDALASIDDLRGKRFAFVDRRSASGYLYPLAFLRRRGIDPETFFASSVFAGNHDRVVEMVLAGEVDAGATYSGAVAMARSRRGGDRLEILEKAGRVPYDAYCASARLDVKLASQVQAALLALSTRTAEGRRVLAGSTSINGFAPAFDADYDGVRQVAEWLRDTPQPGAPQAMQ